MLPRLARHSIWLFVARLGTQLGMALFTILVARQLGSAGFGEYTFIAALIIISNMLTTFGTDMYLIREIAARDDLSQLPAALFLQMLLSVLFVAGVFLASPYLPLHSSNGLTALQIYSLSLLPLAFYTVFTTTLRGKQQIGAYTVLNLALMIFQVTAALIVFFAGGNLVTLSWLLLLSQLCAALFAGILCATKIPGFWNKSGFSMRESFLLMKVSAPIALLSALGSLYQRLSLILLPFLGGTAETGVFSVSARMVEAVKVAHIAVFTAIYPMMAQRSKQEANWLHSFRLPWAILLMLAALASFFLSTLANMLVKILFGSEFAATISVLQILAWSLVPYTINTYLSLAFLAGGRESLIIRALAVSLLGLAVMTIWWEQVLGPPGAAWAMLIAEIMQSAILLSQIVRGRVPSNF